ncbi:organic solute transporter subunit beta [Eublepharis macularius]|uniref:Organic solute transporter subunit beta n=1 Tax=Eublepharis macularius TaxID=481883 RepID=A0AA97KMN3_EUBMA|nr:organic solute transporter subunit beta [Eublepharis macularius]
MDADRHRLSSVALSSQPQDISEGSINTEMDLMSPEKLQELIWFFRTEDPSAWNYCILALSAAVLFLGIILLMINVTANRNRKATVLYSEGYEAAQPDETEMKQAFVSLKEDGHSETAADDLLPKVQNVGEVMIQWKDGNVTPLYPGLTEEDIKPQM